MNTKEYTILPYSDKFKKQVLDVWERSVLATHNFLSAEDFAEIKALVWTIDFKAFPVFCLIQQDKVHGFIGIADAKIEMLFLDPNDIGFGLGKQLMTFALNEIKAIKVDVNEQNIQAVNFYKKFGFETYERTDKDDQGKDYPLLRMKLAKS